MIGKQRLAQEQQQIGASHAGAEPGRLVAVVVTHDRLKHLQETLARLLESPAAILEAVVVVDNASGAGTADWLSAQKDPRLVVLRNETNVGGAGGFETGMKLAAARFDPDWIVVMDDDARPAPGALAAFAAADHRGWGAVAAAVRYPDGRICEMNRPTINPFWHPTTFLRTVAGTVIGRQRDGFHLPPAAYEGSERLAVDAASFVGLFVSREAVARAGFPDGSMFLYGDDVVYTLALRRLGLRICFDPAIAFEHDCSTFSGNDLDMLWPLWKVYYRCRNVMIVDHTAAGVLFWLLLPMIVLRFRLAARRYGADRRTYLRLMWRAIGDGLTRRNILDHEAVKALAATGTEARAAPR